MIVAIHFGATEEDEPKLVLLLKTDYIFHADSVCLPEILVEVFAVPTTILSSQVVNVVESVGFHDSL
jgi:hypothetical protein